MTTLAIVVGDAFLAMRLREICGEAPILNQTAEKPWSAERDETPSLVTVCLVGDIKSSG